MGLRINTNIASINARRNLAAVTARIRIRFRRLSTGLRIATAADDPAGLAMSERMRARIRSLNQNKRNAQDGISMTSVAEGALDGVSSILIKLRELSIQAANGTTSASDRDTIQEEFSTLVAEIDRIGRGTEFNGQLLLDGSTSSVKFIVGADLGGIVLDLAPMLASSLGLGSLNVGSGGDTSTAIASLDSAINTVSRQRGRFGALQNRLGYAISNIANQVENLSAAESRIRDADIAEESALLVRDQILQQAALAVLAQANQAPALALQLIQGIGR